MTTTSKNDYGASHDFKKSEIRVNELKISRTVYFKARHLEYLSKMSEEMNINISQATDFIIQLGIAYRETQRFQKEVKV